VNWFWINIPLMAVFFVAMTGIPLWLVFKHPDEREPVPAHQGQALPDSVAVRYAVTHARTAPMRAVRLSAAGSDDGFALPPLAGSRR